MSTGLVTYDRAMREGWAKSDARWQPFVSAFSWALVFAALFLTLVAEVVLYYYLTRLVGPWSMLVLLLMSALTILAVTYSALRLGIPWQANHFSYRGALREALKTSGGWAGLDGACLADGLKHVGQSERAPLLAALKRDFQLTEYQLTLACDLASQRVSGSTEELVLLARSLSV